MFVDLVIYKRVSLQTVNVMNRNSTPNLDGLHIHLTKSVLLWKIK
jgi:hypothetical protein